MSRADRHTRADKDFLEDLEGVKLARLNNHLERKMVSNTELTRMARNSSAYDKLLKELSTIPRRNNVK